MNPYHEIELYDEETSTRIFIVIDRLIGNLATGGIRMSSTVTMDEIRELAHVMTKKNCIMGIPLGGAKVGIVGNPEGKDRENKIRAFAKMAESLLKTNLLVGEDMGITSSDVKTIYRTIQFDPSELVITMLRERGIQIQLPEDKTIDDLLSKDFMEYLAGFGLLEAIKEAVDLSNIDLTQSKVALQGFGTVGSGIAMLLARNGATISAVSDVHKCIYRDEGFTYDELLTLQAGGRAIEISQITNYKELDREEIFSLPVDILIPASIPHVIHKDNADNIKAKLIVEGGNLPTTQDAEQILLNNNKLILPDFVVNAGSATGFGLMITGQSEYDDVFEVCAKRIRGTVKAILTESLKSQKTPREVANDMFQNNLSKLLNNQSEVEIK